MQVCKEDNKTIILTEEISMKEVEVKLSQTASLFVRCDGTIYYQSLHGGSGKLNKIRVKKLFDSINSIKTKPKGAV